MMSKKDTFAKIKKKPKNLEEIMSSAIEQIQVLDVFDPESKTLMKTTTEALKKSFYKPPEKTAINVVYKVMYPEDLNLKPVPGSQKSRNRPGRPKKSPEGPIESPPPPQKPKIKVVSKTRSGREVKFPKYIQTDFKKIEIDDNTSHTDPSDPNNCDIKTTDFVSYTEVDKQREELNGNKEKLPKQLDSVQKKRRIGAQYRCPKCKKAYLGRSKILDHLRKNPSHGPMHQNEENHFEVWNYLVSITQKCPSSERGLKFCQELSNLLHNLLLLTNALFKKLGSAANEVKIDKVLGNAIGLSPGTYYFDDNNLYKDVTVLQLMGNTDFLNSIRSKTDDNLFQSSDLSDRNCKCGKLSTLDELVLKSMLISSEANDLVAKKIDNIKIDQQKPAQVKCEESKAPGELVSNKFSGDDFFVSTEVNLSNYSPLNDYEMKPDLESRLSANNLTNPSEQNDLTDPKEFVHLHDKKDTSHLQSIIFKPNIDIKNLNDKHFSGNNYFSSNLSYEHFSVNYNSNQSLNHISIEPVHDKTRPKSPKIKIQSNILICPPNPKYLQTNCSKPYSDNQTLQNKNPINPELLTDNSVLMPISNLQHSVDELMLPVSSSVPGNILDNSSSSDEVMNVDQFVNERFRRITESDLEVTNSNSLNLDLPALDLFQFHTT